jgi:hypothetical protein
VLGHQRHEAVSVKADIEQRELADVHVGVDDHLGHRSRVSSLAGRIAGRAGSSARWYLYADLHDLGVGAGNDELRGIS